MQTIKFIRIFSGCSDLSDDGDRRGKRPRSASPGNHHHTDRHKKAKLAEQDLDVPVAEKLDALPDLQTSNHGVQADKAVDCEIIVKYKKKVSRLTSADLQL